jgi:hypothetical protein
MPTTPLAISSCAFAQATLAFLFLAALQASSSSSPRAEGAQSTPTQEMAATAAASSSSSFAVITATSTADFIHLLPKDVLLMMTNDFLDNRSAAALGRTAWMHLRSMRAYRIKRLLSFTGMLRMMDAAEREAGTHRAKSEESHKRSAFGRSQTTHLVMTRDDLSRDHQTQEQFLEKIARLPGMLTHIKLCQSVLDAPRIVPPDEDSDVESEYN